MTRKNYDRDKVMDGFEQDWKGYKRARNTFLLLFVLYVPVCGGIAIVSIRLFDTFTPGFVAAFLWMALLVVSGTRVNLWRCPNCGQWFSGTWWYNLGFLARRCVHCGLPNIPTIPLHPVLSTESEASLPDRLDWENDFSAPQLPLPRIFRLSTLGYASAYPVA